MAIRVCLRSPKFSRPIGTEFDNLPAYDWVSIWIDNSSGKSLDPLRLELNYFLDRYCVGCKDNDRTY